MTPPYLFACSSACPDAPLDAEGCLALAKQQARLAKWYGHEPCRVEFTTELGEFDDPGAIDVRVVETHGDAPPGAIAWHTVENGRGTIWVLWGAVQASGGTLKGPNGLYSAISHELCETAEDEPCDETVPLPGDGADPLRTSLEVCDWVQGSDYEEDGSPGIWLANAVGSYFWGIGNYRAEGLDIASDLRAPTVTVAFTETSGGYHDVIAPDGTSALVFGDRVPEHVKARLLTTGPRAGKRRARMALTE